MANTPSESQIVKFATWFCNERIKTFQKDMSICMTPDEKRSHAYMPALMGCASFIELFAGLFVGKTDPVGIDNIIKFTNKFLDNSEFTKECIRMFFTMFRHKVAHVSRPYSVFVYYDGRRFTWKITATFKKPAIQIISKAGYLKKSSRPPWKPAPYSHVCQINLKRMIQILPIAVSGPHGYLNSLSTDPGLMKNFIKCMDSFYP